MDNWQAPQWADFNATVMSDIEDFFQTEHEEHERKTSFDSFEESNECRSSVSSADYNTPKSNCSSPMPKGNSSRSACRGNFSILTPKSNYSSPMPRGNSLSSMSKGNTSNSNSKGNYSIQTPKSNYSSPLVKSNFSSPMVKGNFSSSAPKNMGNFSSPIPSRISRGSSVKKSGDIFSSAIDSLQPNSQKKIRHEKENRPEDDLVYRDNGEEETAENNRTLVADEDEEECQSQIMAAGKMEEKIRNENEIVRDQEQIEIRTGDEKSEALILNSSADISEHGRDERVNKALDASKSELVQSGIGSDVETKEKEKDLPVLEDTSAEKSADEFVEEERSKLDEQQTLSSCPIAEKNGENVPISRLNADLKVIADVENTSENKISEEEKSNLAKLVSQLDPPKRLILENKSGNKIPGENKSKLTKLVSHLDPSKRGIHENKLRVKISGEEKSKLAKIVSQLDPSKRPIVAKKSADKLSEDKSNGAKLVSQLDPLKRPILDRKNPSSRAPVKPRVLTSQVRRHSISKYRRRSNQYVSLAEAVSKFQTGTPKRFRSTTRKDDKIGPVQKTKQTAMKLTCPMSPALLCKFRARAVSVPNAEEREKLEIEEIRKNLIKPNPIKTSAKNISRLTKKPRTQSDSAIGKNSKTLPRPVTKIFNRQTTTEKKSTTQTKTLPDPPTTSSEIKTAMDPPKGPMRIIKKPSGLSSTDLRSSVKATPTKPPNAPTLADKKLPAPCESAVPPERKKEAHLMSTSMSKHTPCKKMIPSLVSTENGEVIKNVEILHFGIPIDNDYKNKNITRTIPFSFDTRYKESQTKKEKLKTQQNEMDKSRKSTFHARPAPAFVKATTTARAPVTPKEKDIDPNKPPLCPLSFQERNELLLQKKKKMIEDAAEKEKKARVFHAKPAPALKPVFVRGASAENLRTSSNAFDNDKRKSRGLSPSTRQRGLSQDSVIANQENKPPNMPNQPASMQCPKLKNPLMAHNLVIKKTNAGK